MRSEAYSKPAVPMPLQRSAPAWTAPVKCMPPSKRDAPQAPASASTVSYVSVTSVAGVVPGSTLDEPAGATCWSGGSVFPVAARNAFA